MHALKDTATLSRSGQMAGPAPAHTSNLASAWAQGRRRITPWAYPHLRALGALRLVVGVFLIGLGALLISHGYSGLAALPLVGAALNISIGYLDTTAARAVLPRT